jgi:plastocyanin
VSVRRRALVACALAAAAVSAVAVSASSGSPAAKRATTKVTVADDYFAPTGLKVKRDDKVKWVWSDANTDTHNVVLTNEHPKKVKKSDFRSSSGAVGIEFKRKFVVPGTYGFICTYHRGQMQMTLKVKRH